MDDRSGAADRSRSTTQRLLEIQRLARIGVTMAVLAPPNLVEHGPVLCPIRRTTGVPCPSCGLTRSWSAVAHGRLGDGFRMHPLGPFAFAAAVALSLTPRRWLERAPAYPEGSLEAFAAAWIGVWLGRLVAGAGPE